MKTYYLEVKSFIFFYHDIKFKQENQVKSFLSILITNWFITDFTQKIRNYLFVN